MICRSDAMVNGKKKVIDNGRLVIVIDGSWSLTMKV